MRSRALDRAWPYLNRWLPTAMSTPSRLRPLTIGPTHHRVHQCPKAALVLASNWAHHASRSSCKCSARNMAV